MHAGSLAPFEVDLKLWPKEQCFEAAVSMLQCLGLRWQLQIIEYSLTLFTGWLYSRDVSIYVCITYGLRIAFSDTLLYMLCYYTDVPEAHAIYATLSELRWTRWRVGEVFPSLWGEGEVDDWWDPRGQNASLVVHLHYLFARQQYIHQFI